MNRRTLREQRLGSRGVVSNRPPSTPVDMHLRWLGQGIAELTWAPATDAEQDGGRTYNVRVGTAPGLNDGVSGLALPDGRALIADEVLLVDSTGLDDATPHFYRTVRLD